MIFRIQDIKAEHKRYDIKIDFEEYLYRFFTPAYDAKLNFLGFRRGD